jgi:transcriptional regulator with XRE-family HTH domain
MVSHMVTAPDRIPARRPGSGVPVDPEKLLWWRNKRRLTREELSDRISKIALEEQILDNHGDPVHYSRDAVAKLEHGERHPKMYTFRALCAALRCNPEDLLEDPPGSVPLTAEQNLPEPAEIAEALGSCTDPVSVLRAKLTTRTWNSVSLRSGCLTVGELACADRDGSLSDTRNLGFVQLKEIRAVLASLVMEQNPESAPVLDDVAEAM